jgi:hypothetical protein
MGVVIKFPKRYVERDLEPGDRVSHPTYGKGTVMKVEERDDGFECGVVLIIKFDEIKNWRIIWQSYVTRERA